MRTERLIKTVIIDDEPLAIDSLKLLIEKYVDGLEIIFTTTSVFEAREMIIKLQPHLVFVDIQMPGMNGIQLIQSIPDPHFQVVFVTAFDKYAIEALRLHALDYILKPAQPEDLNRVVQKFREPKKESGHAIMQKLDHLEKMFDSSNKNRQDKIGVAMQSKIVFIPIADIIYCKAEGPYTNIFVLDGKKMVASRHLGEFEQQLIPHSFFRIHHSTIINLKHIKEFQKNDGAYVVMDNNVKLEVSHRKRMEFLQAIDDLVV